MLIFKAVGGDSGRVIGEIALAFEWRQKSRMRSAIAEGPRAGEVLIRVEAAGVNRPDVSQRKGNYPPPPGASDLPVPTGSLTDFVVTVGREVTAEEVNAALKSASEGPLQGIMQFVTDPLVSIGSYALLAQKIGFVRAERLMDSGEILDVDVVARTRAIWRRVVVAEHAQWS